MNYSEHMERLLHTGWCLLSELAGEKNQKEFGGAAYNHIAKIFIDKVDTKDIS